MNQRLILRKLKAHKTDLQQFGVKEIGLFGSFIKGKSTSKSDIDILVDFYARSENFDNLMDLSHFIENLFKKNKVDIVTKNGLSPHISTVILKEVVYV